jgi:hypothetical protein
LTEEHMNFRSATGEEFLKTLEDWLCNQTEVLVLIRYSRAAGNESFEFFTSFAILRERIQQLPAETAITVFRTPQLPLRRTDDDEFIANCLSHVPNGVEFAVVDLGLTRAGPDPTFNYVAGESHDELREDLTGKRGRRVAVGEYPPWLEEGPDVISAYMPSKNGDVKPGVY